MGVACIRIACLSAERCTKMSLACLWQPVGHTRLIECSNRTRSTNVRLFTASKRRPRRIAGNCSAETRDRHYFPMPHASEPNNMRTSSLASQIAQAAAVIALSLTWIWGRPEPAVAGLLPRSGFHPHVETVVSVPPPASVTAAVANTNDSMLMIVVVCLGFWMLSATISAAIGALMHLSGRSLQYGTRAAGSWSSAGILDTFDIMRLPLAYEIEEPARSGQSLRRDVIYKPWDGPESSYIPINMVKVLEPGLREAGLVMRRTLLQPDKDLSIITITSSGQAAADGGLRDNSGNGTDGKNGHGDGHSTGSSNGSNGADG